MTVEDFSVSSIEWLRDSRFDQKVFGKPGKVFLYLAIVLTWIYIVSWIYKDAEHKYFEGSKAKYIWLVVAVFAAPVAWFVYLILRPSSDLDESYLQRIEERYLAFESRGLGYCAKCGAAVDPDHLYCSSCGAKLRSKCKKCGSLVEAEYTYCPSCGTKQDRNPKTTIIGLDEVERAGRIRRKKQEEPAGKPKRKEKEQEPFFERLGGYFSKATSSFFTAFMPKEPKKKKDTSSKEKSGGGEKPEVKKVKKKKSAKESENKVL